MFDTAAHSITKPTPPKEDIIFDNGGTVRISAFDEKPYKYLINGKRGSKEPRITITRNGEGFWIVKAEVSIGEWLFGSNLYLPEEKDLPEYYENLSNFVLFKTGYQFDAYQSRVTRLDVTKDFEVGEAKVCGIIKALAKLTIPRYDRKLINDSTVEFQNKGKKKNKKYSIYNKHQKLLDDRADEKLLELSKGLLRLEIQHKENRAVSNLAKSLKLPYHYTHSLFTKDVADIVIKKAMNVLSFEEFLNDEDSALEKLAKNYESSMPLLLAGHLHFKAKYGIDYHQLSFMNLKPATIKSYERKCKKIGCSSLE